MKKKTYVYKGAVKRFNTIIETGWYAETEAESPKKALSNLRYRYAREHGMSPVAKFEFPGTLELKVNDFGN